MPVVPASKDVGRDRKSASAQSRMTQTVTAAAPLPLQHHLKSPHRDLKAVDFWVSMALLGDTVVVLLSQMLGFWIKFRSSWLPFGIETPDMPFHHYVRLIAIGTMFLLSTFAFLRLYSARNLLRYRDVFMVILKGTTFWLFAYLGLSLELKFNPPISRLYVISSYCVCVLSLLLWRAVFFRLLRIEAVARNFRQRIVFVGWNDDAGRLNAAVDADARHPYDILGCVSAEGNRFQVTPPGEILRLGTYQSLPGILARKEVDIVVLADIERSFEEILDLSNLCEKEYVQFKVIPSYFQMTLAGLHLESISGVPILGAAELPLDRLSNRALKRTVDICGAVVGLAISVPMIAICTLAVYLESPGPVFYRQVRTGRNGRNFEIIKIRSMKLNAETAGAQWAKQNDPRRLRIGAFLRKTNIDETPQFWNVLKGNMSLVGPRPERPELIANFKEEIPHYNARHASKTGMTGWAQVNGLRGDTSLVERVRYDLYYLENWSLWLDFQIMFQTFVKNKNAY